jgi:preprotein translocase subunit SecF
VAERTRTLSGVPEAEEPEEEQEQAAPQAEGRVHERRFDVVGRRNWFFALSLLIIIPGLLSMATRGFLLGIDFQGGAELTLQFNRAVTSQQVESAVHAQGINAVVQQSVGDSGQASFVIRTGDLKPADQKAFEDKLFAKLGGGKELQAVTVGGVVAQETVLSAGGAVVLAALLILSYLAIRFSRVRGGFRSGFQFGGSALLALLHDVAVVTGVFSILGKVFGLRIGEIDSLFLTAVLTVVGFSVHDTIVVFDRIRENLNVSQRLSFDQIVNLSIMQTANRSIITSFTVVIVLLALLLFGGDTLRGFVLALLIGIVSGAYSSIFNASPLLAVWRRLQPVR